MFWKAAWRPGAPPAYPWRADDDRIRRLLLSCRSVREFIMSPVRMYTTAVCPYCQRAEQLLNARGVQTIEKIRIDLDPQRRAEMMAASGRRTVPQIWIGERHVGGFDDLAALDRAGELMPLLAAN